MELYAFTIYIAAFFIALAGVIYVFTCLFEEDYLEGFLVGLFTIVGVYSMLLPVLKTGF